MSAMSIDPSTVPSRGGLLADSALRFGLMRFVRGRVPAAEVDDIVQATLAEALASPHAPEDANQLQRWVYGIARHKCVDFYRHQGREAPAPEPMDGDIPTEEEPHSARDLLRWAEKELPEGEHAQSTLKWMLREADGDKLETIADEAKLPAPRVRQRVARMRKHYRTRWAAQVAAIVAAAFLVIGAVYAWRSTKVAEPVASDILPEPPRPDERAAELRREALDACDGERWNECLEQLDEAAHLDPEGDRDPRVTEARRAAASALAPPRAPSIQNDEKNQTDTKLAPTSNEPFPSPKSNPKAPLPFKGKNEMKMAPPQSPRDLDANPPIQNTEPQPPVTQKTEVYPSNKGPVPQQPVGSEQTEPASRGKNAVPQDRNPPPAHQSVDIGKYGEDNVGR